ncbi:MAG: serine/threonine-protein phosphatase [Actinomycetota bacterium]|nr:serine/threonine-protein phosphatase [Actinomycetota bacterium]
MIAISSAVRGFGAQSRSVEELGTRVASYLYEHLVSAGTGSRQAALVRFYKTCAYEELDASQRQFADRALGALPATPSLKCLTLLGTAGEEAGWNDRHASAGHQAIPLPSEAFVESAPMIHRLLQQLQVDVGALVRADTGLVHSVAEDIYHVFYVGKAHGSPHIPAQDFVRTFGISSVLGFGGVLPTGDVFAVILFSRTTVPPETAELFATVALSVTVALLPLLSGPLLDPTGLPSTPTPARPAVTPAELGRAEAVVLHRLLDVHERAAAAESRAVVRAMRELEEEAARYAALARTLQDSLIPPDLPVIPGLETAAAYRPAGDGAEVGGDFYDLFLIRRGVWGLVVGDVSGKGAPAAALTALARHTVRAAGLHVPSPRGVLERLNEAVNRQESRGERYLTAAFAHLRRSRDRLTVTLVLGGHPMALVVRRDGTVEAAGLPGSAIGLFRHIELREATIELSRGDALVFYTDGVTEARSGPVEYGEPALRELLSSLAGATADQIAQGVMNAVLGFQGGLAHDDTAVVVVRVRP